MKKTSRNSRLAAIHMGKKQLGLDDDTYRDMLEQIGGSRSAKDLDDDGLVQVLKHMESIGFSKNTAAKTEFGQKPDVKESKESLINKIEALLADAGRHWNYAHGCAKNMFGKERVQFCTEHQLWKIVAALEKDKQRRANKDG